MQRSQGFFIINVRAETTHINLVTCAEKMIQKVLILKNETEM